MDKPKLNFIIMPSCQRSGTTLTGQIIGAHSQCFLIDEDDGLYQWFYSLDIPTENHQLNLNQILENASKKYLDSRKNIRQLSDINSMRIVLKAPNLGFEYKKLSKINPTPSIIFPIRDARSVVASMLQLKENPMIERQTTFISNHQRLANQYKGELSTLNKKSTPLHIKSAIIWNIKSNLYKQLEEHGLNPLVLNYEQLVKNLKDEVIKIANHCHITFEHNLLSHHKVLQGNTHGNTNRARKVDTESLNLWKRTLTPKQERDILEITHESMLNFGYVI
jgi:hypothetical protein